MAEEQKNALAKKLAEIRRAAEERDAERRAKKLGIPYVDLRKVPVSLEAVKLLTETQARAANAAAIELKQNELALALFDPGAKEAADVAADLERRKYTVKKFLASMSGLEQVWQLYRFVPEESKEITGRVGIEKQRLAELVLKLHNLESVQEEVKKFDFKKLATTTLLEIILAGALTTKASDIHFESEENGVRIRFRLDGLLHDIFTGLPARNYGSLVSRIKLLSGLKINVHGEPQDGRFTIALEKKEVEMRVSIIPSEFGETIVMRILNPDAIQVSLSDLGLRGDDLILVEREIAKPNGLILNTGPTGSGKTTTLYAFIRKVLNPEVKIITIEDPIEYRVEGIEQTQVNPDVGYTFANGLRAILRQDPDVILVGEVRDLETADIAMQASLTGHLVLSTLHTNDAVGAVPRLIDLGVRAATVGPALSLVIAQRLVRRFCEKCRKARPLSQVEKAKARKFLDALPSRVDRKPYESTTIYEPGGCVACNNFGYKGRVGIFEFLEAGAEFEETILNEASEVALRRLAKKQQMVSMQEDGILKVLAGATSFDEIEKVTGPLLW